MFFRRVSSATSRRLAAAAGGGLLVLVAGCAGSLHPRAVLPTPEYRYPEDTTTQSLELVSLFSDPLGATLNQGGTTAPTDAPYLFRQPIAAVWTAGRTLFVLDRGTGLAWRLTYDSKGQLTGRSRLDHDGRPFTSAIAMAATPSGGVWISDSADAVVYRYAADGSFIGEVSGFGRPVGIAYHPGLGRMIVADLMDSSLHLLHTDGRRDLTRGTSTGTDLEAPSFLAVGPRGRVYVVEALAARVKVLDTDWRVTDIIGGPGDGPGFFAKPKGIAVDSAGRIFVVDTLFDNVQIFSPAGELLLALGNTGSGAGQFWQPSGISIDAAGRLYIADTYNHRVQIYAWEKDSNNE